jgi:hypothetical protein
MDALDRLNLGTKTLSTCDASVPSQPDPHLQRAALWWVLGINFSFFMIEMVASWIAHSMGLIADSLDMLADSMVYELSLFAVGAVVATKKKIARLSGYFQMALAFAQDGDDLLFAKSTSFHGFYGPFSFAELQFSIVPFIGVRPGLRLEKNGSKGYCGHSP